MSLLTVAMNEMEICLTKLFYSDCIVAILGCLLYVGSAFSLAVPSKRFCYTLRAKDHVMMPPMAQAFLLCLQDGRQKGEVQLTFSFKSADSTSASSSLHNSQSQLALQGEHSSPSSRPSSARVTLDSTPDTTVQQRRGGPASALSPELTVESLGPLGQSFLNLARTHISPDNDQEKAQVPEACSRVSGCSQGP